MIADQQYHHSAPAEVKLPNEAASGDVCDSARICLKITQSLGDHDRLIDSFASACLVRLGEASCSVSISLPRLAKPAGNSQSDHALFDVPGADTATGPMMMMAAEWTHTIDASRQRVVWLDTEGVIDPVDLTICRLLLVPSHPHSSVSRTTVWFATRSGFIGRLRLDQDVSDETKAAVGKLEVPRACDISVSCHGYRRPVCNLIAVHECPGSDSSQDLFIIAVGHDYVHLRPQQQFSPAHMPVDSNLSSYVLDSLSRLRQMGSGAHAIVWKLSPVCV
ncbi:hypothetical protein AHF37_03664 [Paragonimus kellicotti]|nr:hypothetical protein AHF37_03664 [Paragonimus kellicotti]